MSGDLLPTVKRILLQPSKTKPSHVEFLASISPLTSPTQPPAPWSLPCACQADTMPPLGIPISAKTVDIHIFDTQFRILNGRPQAFMCPPIKGFDRMDALAYSFLITHTGDHGKISRYLFDLGAPKNWKQDLPPPVADEVKKWERAGIVIESPKYMTEVLEENGLRAEEIDGLVWRCHCAYSERHGVRSC